MSLDDNFVPESGSIIIRNVHLVYGEGKLFDVHCRTGVVTAVQSVDEHPATKFTQQHHAIPQLDTNGEGILLPSLCHSHVHLDKCFLLDNCGDLQSGGFQEALQVTTEAKSRFIDSLDDVYRRGRRLIVESMECGVTVMRAHVEVDKTVGLRCLEIALRLKEDFQGLCEIQVAVFAQDPLFDDPHDEEPGDNYSILCDAARVPGVSVVGSAPYVEPQVAQSRRNISLLLRLAVELSLHADFHLDYNIDPSSPPLIYDVLKELKELDWAAQFPSDSIRKVTIGHGTRYSLFDSKQWEHLKFSVGDLPVSFVALPQSDMYMMGKGGADRAILPSRGTIPVPFVAGKELEVALSVNNVGNAFTPQGSVDPLLLCPLGIAIYQDASLRTCNTLLDCISISSKRAIGVLDVGSDFSTFPQPGDTADFVLLHDNASARSAVLAPCYSRTTVRGGTVVATRTVQTWTAASHTPLAPSSMPLCLS
ncbi:hypothetical protein EW146_g8271 [Bondarzewia mesenterica]|uniref:Amidohydrolase-related domain-containing protein n=1 Tax=Bondarzewia mesenterica TaxID=1095465 RepID=A0A4S4LFS0_9AGAM|nr:hypothetical protein EW146_g8271 [Bondarzewia mesenterica]